MQLEDVGLGYLVLLHRYIVLEKQLLNSQGSFGVIYKTFANFIINRLEPPTILTYENISYPVVVNAHWWTKYKHLIGWFSL